MPRQYFCGVSRYLKRNLVKNFDCNRGVCVSEVFDAKTDVTPSNDMEMKFDATKQIKMTSR